MRYNYNVHDPLRYHPRYQRFHPDDEMHDMHERDRGLHDGLHDELEHERFERYAKKRRAKFITDKLKGAALLAGIVAGGALLHKHGAAINTHGQLLHKYGMTGVQGATEAFFNKSGIPGMENMCRNPNYDWSKE